ncbi:hypothetical protein [Actinomadura sp. 6N118]|uniref:hypothetical protein n=1 Tax=Actinomadura sp. 6N118 TaxID=3375151 RepID=UPI0037AD37A0
MTFDGLKHRETRPNEQTPDSRRVVFLDELGGEIARVWPALRAERLSPADGLPTRLMVTRYESDAREEIGCDFDAVTGWWFVWRWDRQRPQRIGHVRAVQQVAHSVASVMGMRALTV